MKNIIMPIISVLFGIGCLIMAINGLYSFIGYHALKSNGITTTATVEKYNCKFNVFGNSENDPRKLISIYLFK